MPTKESKSGAWQGTKHINYPGRVHSLEGTNAETCLSVNFKFLVVPLWQPQRKPELLATRLIAKTLWVGPGQGPLPFFSLFCLNPTLTCLDLILVPHSYTENFTSRWLLGIYPCMCTTFDVCFLLFKTNSCQSLRSIWRCSVSQLVGS